MSAEEAYDFICQVSDSLGTVGIEQYSTYDGDKLREAARALYLEVVKAMRMPEDVKNKEEIKDA